jgi:hypothetical protein
MLMLEDFLLCPSDINRRYGASYTVGSRNPMLAPAKLDIPVGAD